MGAAMSRWSKLTVLLIAAVAAFNWWSSHQQVAPAGAMAVEGAPASGASKSLRDPTFLPPEAIETLQTIERGGPFAYDRDGVVFQNRERRLPERPRGYYHEYTVVTPGASNRGARRIIAGGAPPEVYYYTDDHYRTFRRVEPQR
jgi:ribonuclease T1